MEERNVLVPMRDGLKVSVDIFRPEGSGKVPALLALSPYGKGHESLSIPPLPPRSSSYTRSIEAGDPAYLVSHGYAHIIGDVRGTGGSEGEYRGWMSKKEAEDGYDLVEWIAKQPWCDGNVGMVGISYFGTIQLMVAAERPPHLKAIMPWNAVADYYREATHHGGILHGFFNYLYLIVVPTKRAVTVTKEGVPGAEFTQLLERAKSDPDLRLLPELYKVIDNPEVSPCFLDVLLNRLDNEFYWERSPYRRYNQVSIPFYASSGWWAYAHMHLSGAFRNFTEIDAPKKLLVYGQEDTDSPLPLEYNEEAVRWYDRWLKGRDTGVMDEPPIKIFVLGKNQWRFENEWPLARTKWTRFFLRRWEGLSEAPEPTPGKPDSFVQQPIDETDKIQFLQYFTNPLLQDLEVTGPIAFYLHASVNQDDTNWMVCLKDADDKGKELEISKGFLKASHRELDRNLSKEWRPFHPHNREVKVVPGEINDYAIEMSPTSIVFRASHRMKVEIKSIDMKGRAPPHIGEFHYPYHLCGSRTTLHQIYHDEHHPSHILLPVVPS